jgi:hypothetical protein
MTWVKKVKEYFKCRYGKDRFVIAAMNALHKLDVKELEEVADYATALVGYYKRRGDS